MIAEFGTYNFTFWQKIILFLTKTGIVGGSPRKWLRKLFWSITPSDSIFDITYESVRMRISPIGNNTEGMFILRSKIHDEKEIKAIISALPENGVFLDIGANVGYYSLMVASKCPSARIISYEPNINLLEKMNTNIKLNNFENITVLDYAIGDSEYTAELKIDSSNVGSSSIRNIKDRIGNENQKIQVKTLKNSLESLGIEKVHALKIDVEGYEDKALLPYFNSVDKRYYPDMIIIEHFNQECWDVNVIDFLLENGYYEFKKAKANLILIKDKR